MFHKNLIVLFFSLCLVQTKSAPLTSGTIPVAIGAANIANGPITVNNATNIIVPGNIQATNYNGLIAGQAPAYYLNLTNATGYLQARNLLTGMGITNVNNVLSNNIVAGSNILIALGNSGQLIISSSSTGTVRGSYVVITNGTSLNQTLSGQPIILDFTLSNHGHTNASSGGQLDASAISTGTIDPARLGGRTIIGFVPLFVSNGNGIGGNPTIIIPKATSTNDGYISSNDWTGFALKQNAFTTGLGITNNGTILSNNIVAGTSVTIVAGSNGQLTINSLPTGSGAPVGTTVNTASTTSGQIAIFNDNQKTNLAPITIGLGLTNNGSTLSNNIVAGSNVSIVGGSAGQLSISANQSAYSDQTLVGNISGSPSIPSGLTVPQIYALLGLSYGTNYLPTTNGTGYGISLNGLTTIPVTTATNGIFYMGTNLFLHEYHDPLNDGHNTFLGVSAGNLTLYYGGGDINEGAHNVGVGDYALQSLTTGYANNAFGYVSQQYSTNAYHNAGFGDDTLRVNQGHYNTAIGIISMRGNITGFQNTAVGHQSLDGNISGNYNVAIGNSSLLTATNADRNTGVGDQSLYNALGGNNTAIGQNAGYTTTGTGNVIIGALAGFYATGDNNFILDNQLRGTNENNGKTNYLIFGQFAGQASNQWLRLNAVVSNSFDLFQQGNVYLPSTTPTNGIVVVNNSRFIHSYSAPLANGHNTFLGKSSGNFSMIKVSGIDASYNTGLGESDLASLTTGSENSAGGYGSLAANTTGTENTGFGSSSLTSSTIGKNNSAFGQAALTLSTSDYNSAFGRAALNNVVSGQRNTAIGESAGFNVLGDRNSFLGNNSGYNNTGSDNLFLGTFSGFYETGSNKLFVDNQTRANEASGRTNALMYGVFDSTSRTNQTLAVNANLTTLTLNSSSITGSSVASGNMLMNNNGFYAGGGASGQGRFWYSGANGSTIQGQTGSTYDATISDLNNVPVFTIPHGTSSGFVNASLTVRNDILAGGNVTATNGFTGSLNGNSTSSTVATNIANNKGTTTTVLHGNASGAPSFGSVNLATDVTGNLPNINTTQEVLLNSGATNIDWANRILVSSGNIATLHWGDGKLVDTSGNQSINWDLRQLDNTSGTAIYDWSSGKLVGDGSGLTNISGGITSTGTVINVGTPVAGAFYKYSGTSGTNAIASKANEDSSGNLTVNGNILQPVGNGISIHSGSNQRAGLATLVGGTVTVANTTVTANTIVICNHQNNSGSLVGVLGYVTNPGVGFTINSAAGVADISQVAYLLIEVP